MKKEVIQLAMKLYELHKYGDELLKQDKLPCRDQYGNKTGWEFDKTAYYYEWRKERYIGLGMYQAQIRNIPEFEEAYKFLCDAGLLKRLSPDHIQFKVLDTYPDIEKFFKEEVLSVPIQLQDFYRNYISSNEWKEKANARLKMDNHLCVDCGKVASEVHHQTYERLGHEDMNDIVSLCHECHKKRHNRK